MRIINIDDNEYPERLRNIYSPPKTLYVKGTLPQIDEFPIVGIVGTRKCTPYGISAAERVSRELSQSGILVTTGMALGVDAAAAKGALQGRSPVIGVVATGVDIEYPVRNRSLYAEILDNGGAIISEFPPGTLPLKHHFPLRNRIISGISLGVAVIEAPKKSGALITAARALEQGRDVFSLPGNVDAVTNEGSNALLREGAIPFMSADDIIDEYIGLYPDKITALNSSSEKKPIDNTSKVDYIDLGNLLDELEGDEKKIVGSIGRKSVLIDDIIAETGFPSQKVMASLTMLELGGYIHSNNNGFWETTV